MPKVTAEHREQRRAEILCAARQRFAREGFHATSMQDILDESGLSAGAVYTYFPSKTEIVSAIAAENVATVLHTLQASTGSSPDLSVADAVVTAVRSVRATRAPQRTARLALQVWAESTRDPQLREQFGDTHDQFRAILAGLILRRHPEMTGDADCMAGVISTLVPGLLMQLGLLDAEQFADFERGVRLVLGDL